MISFQNVTKIYPPNTTALEGVEFEIKQGEFVSVVGRSGAGKTTLLKMVMAEEPPTKGVIIVGEVDVNGIPKSKLPEFRRHIGPIFQEYRLIPSKTAYENIAYALEVIGVNDKQIAEEVAQVLEVVNLGDRARHFPDQLSGGERQRVAIARALVHRPQVILADEPTGNLDPYHARDIVRILSKINEMGTTVILATHNREIINKLGRRVITLEDGRVVRDDEQGRFIL